MTSIDPGVASFVLSKFGGRAFLVALPALVLGQFDTTTSTPVTIWWRAFLLGVTKSLSARHGSQEIRLYPSNPRAARDWVGVA